MATSGTTQLGYTVTQIVQEAAELTMIVGNGQTLSGSRYDRIVKTLNIMLKAWEQQGIHLWAYDTGYLFLNKGQAEYNFTTSNLTNAYSQTSLDAVEAIGQTVLSVTATTLTGIDGVSRTMTTADIIGIVTEDNDIHWSTIASISAGDTVTIDDALTVAATSGAVVFWYTPNTFNPVHTIINMRRRSSSGAEIPLNDVSRATYDWQPNKSSTADMPVMAHYDRQEPTGTLFIWPAAANAATVIPFTYQRRLEVATDPDETLDIPESWFETVTYNLAKRIPFKYACPPERWNEIKQMAASSLIDSFGDDSERTPIYVQMER